MKRVREWLIDNCDVIIGVIALFALIVVTLVIVSAGASNAMNRINEGVVIDKQYYSSYTTTNRTTVDGKTVITPRYVPEKYYFTIEGEKNGEVVQYSFKVTAEEYNDYHIGDYYRK